MIDRLGDADRFFSIGYPLSEFSELRKGLANSATGGNRGQAGQTEALATQIACQQGHVLSE